MITETGRVVGIERDFLWVETIRRSACNSCVAKQGCGQSLLNRIGDGKRNHIRALLGSHRSDEFALDDDVEISVPENVLLRAALVVYLGPLLAMLAGMGVADSLVGGEYAAALGALLGLSAGLAGVKLHALLISNNPDYQPSVLRNLKSAPSHPGHYSAGEL